MTDKKTTVPAGAKKPTDRKPKAEDAPSVLTVTLRDVDWTIEPEALDDFELLDDIRETEVGNATRLPSVLNRLLGAEQSRKAMDVLRDKTTGRVSIEAGAEFVGEIFEELNPSS